MPADPVDEVIDYLAKGEDIDEEESEDEEENLEEEELDNDELSPDELNALFNKNTQSFRCLAQVLLSRSSILNHPLYAFPPPVDPGIDAAFTYVEPEVTHDSVGVAIYKQECKLFGVVPISRINNSLATTRIDLRYYGLSTKQVKSLCKALMLNTHVQELILEENVLEPDAVWHLSEMIGENNCLRYVSLKNCQIGSEGAKNLREGIASTQSLVEIDLSSNHIRCEGLLALCKSLRDTMIQRFNLSRNSLTQDCAYRFGVALSENEAIEVLDLSWNHFNTPMALKPICEGLGMRNQIRILNLAWNGLSDKDAFVFIVRLLKTLTSLEHIDLSNNQLNGVLWKMMRSGILSNNSLTSINLGCNILDPDEAERMIDVFNVSREEPLKLKYMDLENAYVMKSFLPRWRALTRQGIHINIEGVLRNWTIKGPDVKKVVFDRLRFLATKSKKKKKKPGKEFGHFLHSIPEEHISKGVFLKRLKKFKMKKISKDRDLLNEITKAYTVVSNQLVDVQGMRSEYYAYYPETTLPVPKKKKMGKGKGKGKKGKKGSKSTDGETTGATTDTEASTEVSQKRNVVFNEAPIVSVIVEPYEGDTEGDVEDYIQTDGEEVADMHEADAQVSHPVEGNEARRITVDSVDQRFEVVAGSADNEKTQEEVEIAATDLERVGSFLDPVFADVVNK